MATPLIPRLGVNIDHVATLRQLRGTPYPDLMDAATRVARAGAHQITVHLREDRRHIQDEDVKRLRAELSIPLNLEMAASPEIIRIASRVRPAWACLVPEKRREVTTEGGLELARNRKRLGSAIHLLKGEGILVSLFIEPTCEAVKISHDLDADAVELHTGRYCLLTQSVKKVAPKSIEIELKRLRAAMVEAKRLGLHVHAGHGLDAANVRALAAMDLIEEFNIGHSIVCRAVLVGMEQSVREMISAITAP